MDPRSWIGS